MGFINRLYVKVTVVCKSGIAGFVSGNKYMIKINT